MRVPPSNVARAKNGNDFIYSGIDRVDNSIGYTEGNVVPCCITCNKAKSKQTSEEFLKWVQRVYHHSIGEK